MARPTATKFGMVKASSRQSAQNRKARLEMSVLVNDWTSSGMTDEHKVRLQTRSVIQSVR